MCALTRITTGGRVSPVSSDVVFFNHLSRDVGGGIPKPFSFLHETLHKKSGKKRGKKNCPEENNSGSSRVPPKIIKMLEFHNFGIPFGIRITVRRVINATGGQKLGSACGDTELVGYLTTQPADGPSAFGPGHSDHT